MRQELHRLAMKTQIKREKKRGRGDADSSDESVSSDSDDGADSGWYNRLSTKGEPGVDSVNRG